MSISVEYLKRDLCISYHSPLGLNLAEEIGGLSLSNKVFRQCPLCVSQIRSSPSKLLDNSKEPSGLKSTAVTGSECAGTSRKHRPLRTSHTRIVSSKDPDARRWPWGWKLQQKT